MDWNILENNSGVNDGTEYTETFVENKYIDKQPNTKPGATAYNDQFINTAIIPNKYTSVKLPTIMDTEITALTVMSTTRKPTVKTTKLKYGINGKYKKDEDK